MQLLDFSIKKDKKKRKLYLKFFNWKRPFIENCDEKNKFNSNYIMNE